jgi:hypothetical protein
MDKSGLTQVYDARVFLKASAVLNKYDKITHDGRVYRVDKISTRDFNGTSVFQVASLFYISNE